MAGFVKVYSSILDSSVWGESLATRVVWIALLAMADQHGLVEASSDGIARSANVPLKQSDKALEVLSSPDPRSKSEDEHEGRRIERVDGGYRILNYLKYRELQTPSQKANAERQKRWREAQALRNSDITATNDNKRAKAKAEANKRTTKTKTTSSGADAPETKKHSWVAEGAEWWTANVGTIGLARFGKALKDSVDTHGWPKVFAALREYAADCKSRGKPARPEWCAAEIIRWIEWAEMPATDENGDLTARGKAIVGGK